MCMYTYIYIYIHTVYIIFILPTYIWVCIRNKKRFDTNGLPYMPCALSLNPSVM